MPIPPIYPKYATPLLNKAPSADNFLHEIMQQTVGGFPLGYEKIIVTDVVKKLTVPKEAIFAEFRIISNQPLTDEEQAVRYRFDAPPTITEGLPWPNGCFFTIQQYANLEAVQFISAELLKTHTIYINYFKAM